ncbi:hypothetical protein E2320_000775, partial [Naja naja]
RSTTPASNSFSPSLTERKQIGHKSLSIFSRNSKGQPHSLSAKGADPSGWFPLKKMRQDAGDLSMPQGACLQSYKVQEDQRGALEDVKSRRRAEPRPYFEVLNARQNAGTPLGKRGLLAKMEALAETSRQGITLAMCHKVFRRSLSWPDDLSLRDAADETDFSPGEAPTSPGGQEDRGRAEPAPPGMKEVISDMKQLSLHMVQAVPPESPRAGCSGDDSCNLSPKPFPSRSEASEASEGLDNQISQAPAEQLSRRAPLRSNRESQITILSSPKPKTRRRFGRSVSHESGLPLQGEASKGGEARQCSKTPLQQLKACGRQIFITRKHIRSSLAGLWGRKEGYGPTGEPPDQQASLLLEDRQVPQGCRSPQNPAREL